MNQLLRISSKTLGALALPTFCPRCFWIRMMCGDRLPYQGIFPGIFASIDSYSKQVTMTHFRKHGRVPRWFEGFGDLGAPISVPSWSRFQMVDEETNILITGVPDEILRHPERGIWIGDYKTARFTGNQEELAPKYQVQLNCYGLIAEKIGLGSVYGLGLLYYEPVTDLKDPDDEALIKDDRFFLGFSPKLKPVALEPDIIPPLLRRVREIYDLPDTPPPGPDCRDCGMLDIVVRATVGASYFLKQDLIRSLAAQTHR